MFVAEQMDTVFLPAWIKSLQLAFHVCCFEDNKYPSELASSLWRMDQNWGTHTHINFYRQKLHSEEAEITQGGFVHIKRS